MLLRLFGLVTLSILLLILAGLGVLVTYCVIDDGNRSIGDYFLAGLMDAVIVSTFIIAFLNVHFLSLH